jgi:hypothetical protein
MTKEGTLATAPLDGALPNHRSPEYSPESAADADTRTTTPRSLYPVVEFHVPSLASWME